MREDNTRTNRWKTKGFSVSLFLLFISIAFIPNLTYAINTNPINEEFIEISTALCGIPGFKNQTTKLTQQQYGHLRQYLLDFTKRLNTTTSEEETVSLFYDAVEELDTYGLLPVGMSTFQAGKVVQGTYQATNGIRRLGFPFNKKILENSTNYMCLVAGYSEITQFWSTFMRLWFWMSTKFDNFFARFNWIITLLLRFFITMGVWALDYLRPFMAWGEIILFRNTSVFTIGLNGIKQWIGDLYGDIHGFTGFKIKLGLQEPLKYFFIGSAVKVEVAPTDR